MAAPNRNSQPDIHRSEQGVLNWSFDEIYQVLGAMLIGENSSDSTAHRLQATSDGILKTVKGLVDKEYDYLDLGYTGGNLTTIALKSGGSGGTTQRTLTLSYTDGNLTSVSRS